MDLLDVFRDGLRAGLGPNAAIFALLAIGLNVHFGYAGLNNFGQVGFMMLGAYGTAIFVGTWGGSLWLAIPFGLAVCVVFALALGFPTLRLRADYFAITTIAASEIIRFLIRARDATDLTGGPFGIQDVAGDFRDLNPYPESWDLAWGNFRYTNQQLWVITVGWILVLLCVALVAALMRSPWGRVVKSVREDEDAARALGKNAFSYKIQALVLGGAIGGLAGVLDLFNQGGVVPEGFRPETTFFAYTALILGGAATRFGPVLGAMLFWFVRQAIESTIRDLAGRDWPPDFVSDFLDGKEGLITVTLVGLGLVLLVVFRPQGIFGNREEMQLDA